MLVYFYLFNFKLNSDVYKKAVVDGFDNLYNFVLLSNK